jgi:hypothetical protein
VADRLHQSSSGATTPIPDPTELTSRQIYREIASIKELFITRLEAMDKAVALLQATAARSPTINEVFLQHEERFASIKTQFTERDTRTEQTSRDSKVAVDAALQAAKEAVGEQNRSNTLAIAKSETAFAKQVDQIGVQIATIQKGVDDKFEDVKGRLNLLEGMKRGSGDAWAYMLALAGAAIGIAGVAAAMFRPH